MGKPEQDDDIAIQTRCIHCKREQYAPAVMAVSLGEHACVWCGKMSRQMLEPEYRNELLKPIVKDANQL